jgi:hypothetical protein
MSSNKLHDSAANFITGSFGNGQGNLMSHECQLSLFKNLLKNPAVHSQFLLVQLYVRCARQSYRCVLNKVMFLRVDLKSGASNSRNIFHHILLIKLERLVSIKRASFMALF